MKIRKYIKNKWEYWLRKIYLRNKDLQIAPDLILTNLYKYGYGYPYEFYAECKINDYTTSNISMYVYKDCNCLNFTDIVVDLSKANFFLIIYVERIVSDLKKLINKFLSFNSLILTTKIIVNAVEIKGDYDLTLFICLFKEELTKEGWICKSNSTNEFYYPRPLTLKTT